MSGFVHRYASSAHLAPAIENGGEPLGDKLVVIPNIPLSSTAPGYDEAKADELTTAAAKYANNRRFALQFGHPRA